MKLYHLKNKSETSTRADRQNVFDVRTPSDLFVKSFDYSSQAQLWLTRSSLTFLRCNCDNWTLVPCEIIFALWDSLVDVSMRRRGRKENWGKPLARSNWSPVNESAGEKCKTESEKAGGVSPEQEPKASVAGGVNDDKNGNQKMDLDGVTLKAQALGISMVDGTFRSPISKAVVTLDLAVIPQVVFENIKNFYLCSRCGKIYWDGSHYERTNNIYADVLGFDVNNGINDLKIEP